MDLDGAVGALFGIKLREPYGNSIPLSDRDVDTGFFCSSLDSGATAGFGYVWLPQSGLDLQLLAVVALHLQFTIREIGTDLIFLFVTTGAEDRCVVTNFGDVGCGVFGHVELQRGIHFLTATGEQQSEN